MDKRINHAVQKAYEEVMEFPVSGLLLGLESSKSFKKLPYGERLEFYESQKTLMPQTSICFTQDGAIPTPEGLVKSKMAMWVRKEEPDILEIGLREKNYVYRVENRVEGGDVTMCSFETHLHGGDVSYSDGRMLLGINALSGKRAVEESEKLAEVAQIKDLVRFYLSDYFDSRYNYPSGNVIHFDTASMPLDKETLLANKKALEKSIVVRRYGKPWESFVNGYTWANKNYRIVETHPQEQGLCGLDVNVFPLGDNEVLSTNRFKETNKNIRVAGFIVHELEFDFLSDGLGGPHCSILYLLG